MNLFALFLYALGVRVVWAQEGNQTPTTTSMNSLALSPSETAPAAVATTSAVTMSNNTTTSSTLYTSSAMHSPSPTTTTTTTTTTTVLTHFPIPSRLASSSTISSFHPTQSAPYPDDSIGKYGPLHVSIATRPLSHSGDGYSACAVIFVTFLLFLL